MCINFVKAIHFLYYVNCNFQEVFININIVCIYNLSVPKIKKLKYIMRKPVYAIFTSYGLFGSNQQQSATAVAVANRP